MIERFRKKIFEKLSNVEKKDCPKIYNLIQTQKGYERVENYIIELVCKDGLSIEGAIPQIESEWV